MRNLLATMGPRRRLCVWMTITTFSKVFKWHISRVKECRSFFVFDCGAMFMLVFVVTVLCLFLFRSLFFKILVWGYFAVKSKVLTQATPWMRDLITVEEIAEGGRRVRRAC